MRWSLELQEYNFILKYLPGGSNYADFLSRNIDFELEGNIVNTITVSGDFFEEVEKGRGKL